MNYIGIDASLTHTGVAYCGPAVDSPVGVAAWKPPKGRDRGHERLAWFRERFDNLLHVAQPGGRTVVAWEGYAFGTTHNAHSAGELGSVIQLAAYDAAIDMATDFLVVPPGTLKKYVTGKGNAPKSIMLKEVHKRWGFDTDDDNIADAYALMRFAQDVKADPASQTKRVQTIVRDYLAPKAKKRKAA